MRKAFAETLYQLAREDPRLILLTGDLGFQLFDRFQADFKERFINVGVAEAQMMAAAAGFALEGWRPIAYSIASFATARPFEQIRFCIGYPRLPVMIVGAGRGLTYSTSGVSHHALDDIGLMSLIPGMTVVIPGDAQEVRELLPQALRTPGPSYFTVGRYGEPTFPGEQPAVLGKARRLRQGERVAVLTTGEMAAEVMKAAFHLELEGIFPLVFQIHTLRPLDYEALEEAAERVSTFIVVDEHLPTGGLWMEVAAWKAASNHAVQLKRLGPPETFALGNRRREDFREGWGFDAKAIAEECRWAWEHEADAGPYFSEHSDPAPGFRKTLS